MSRILFLFKLVIAEIMKIFSYSILLLLLLNSFAFSEEVKVEVFLEKTSQYHAKQTITYKKGHRVGTRQSKRILVSCQHSDKDIYYSFKDLNDVEFLIHYKKVGDRVICESLDLKGHNYHTFTKNEIESLVFNLSMLKKKKGMIEFDLINVTEYKMNKRESLKAYKKVKLEFKVLDTYKNYGQTIKLVRTTVDKSDPKNQSTEIEYFSKGYGSVYFSFETESVKVEFDFNKAIGI